MSLATVSNIPSDFFYGWDLLYKTVEKEVNKRDDLLIALVHFVLTRHSQFRCIGLGDDKTLTDEDVESGSELLPDNWNADDKNYTLRYVYLKQLIILLGMRTEGSLIVTLLDVNSKKVSNIALDPEELVKEIKGGILKMIPTASELADRFRKELLDPVFTGTTQSTTTQTTEDTNSATNSRPDPLRIGEPRRPPFGLFNPQAPSPFGLPDVGRGDLDPLNRLGPGNLFPFPSNPDNMHPGSFQPRPRFDPFGPPERSIRPNPNPDHLPPPGYGSDSYYM